MPSSRTTLTARTAAAAAAGAGRGTPPHRAARASAGKKTLSNSAINIKRREEYQNMAPAAKDRERTRVKRCRAVRMAKDLLAATAWQALDRKAQWELQMLVERELRTRYPATTPGPSSSTAAAWAVEKILGTRPEVMNALLEDVEDDEDGAVNPDETLPTEWMDWERLTSTEGE